AVGRRLLSGGDETTGRLCADGSSVVRVPRVGDDILPAHTLPRAAGADRGVRPTHRLEDVLARVPHVGRHRAGLVTGPRGVAPVDLPRGQPVLVERGLDGDRPA